MSYSFSVHGSKADAKQRIGQEWDTIVSGQPMHSNDRKLAEAAALGAVDALDGEQVNVACYGSVSWREGDRTTAISLSVSAAVAPN